MREFAEHSDALNEASGRVSAVKQNLADLRATRSGYVGEIADFKSELARLVQLSAEDHAKRLLDGADAAPDKPKRQSRIENLKSSIAGREAALPILDQRIADAQAELGAAQIAFNSVTMEAIGKSRKAAFRDVKAAFDQFVDRAVNLVAHDRLQIELLGRGAIKFNVTSGDLDLINGEAVMRKVFGSLPERLRLSPTETDAFWQKAQAAAQKSISSLNTNGVA